MTRSVDDPNLTYDEQAGTYRLRHTDGGSFCVDLVLAVSAVVDEAPSELEPLYNHIDPDLLNEFARGAGSFSGDVLLNYDGVHLRITQNGEAVIQPDGHATPATDPPG